jgi:hypothetical protein
MVIFELLIVKKDDIICMIAIWFKSLRELSSSPLALSEIAKQFCIEIARFSVPWVGLANRSYVRYIFLRFASKNTQYERL